MKTYQLPDDLLAGSTVQADGVIIRCYRSGRNTIKNKIILNTNMINLLVSGTKTVVYPGETALIRSGELVVLSTGNILTSELTSDQDTFISILLYFSNDVLNRFLIRYNHLLCSPAPQKAKQPFLIYEQDAFIRQYAQSLQLLLDSPAGLSPEIRQLKLEELLLYLLQLNNTKLQQLKIVSKDNADLQLKKVVESHIGQPITVDELAFLCNMSSSTFKRNFKRLYGTSPQQWLLSAKLQQAAELLKSSSESPSQVYFKLGYRNHSSFSQAFREHFGLSPSEYQARQLNVEL